jgi:hypothetical protein
MKSRRSSLRKRRSFASAITRIPLDPPRSPVDDFLKLSDQKSPLIRIAEQSLASESLQDVTEIPLAEPPCAPAPPIEQTRAIPPPAPVVGQDDPEDEKEDPFGQIEWAVEEGEYEAQYYNESMDGMFMF